MKKLMKNSVFRVLIIIAGNFSLGVFLFTYIIPNSLSSSFTIWLTIALFAVFMLVFTITMLCEICYDEASKHLVISADLKKAYEWMMRMKKLDVLGWYKDRYHVFLTIYYRDSVMMEELEKLLEDKNFHENQSMELVYHYNKFIVSIYNNDEELVNASYNKITDIYNENIGKKNSRTALIYSLPMINAELHYYFKRYKKANIALKNVNTAKSNKRELAHYYYLKACVLFHNGNKAESGKNIELASEVYPQGQFIKELGVEGRYA